MNSKWYTLALPLALAIAGCGGSAQSAPPPRARPASVRTVPVAVRDIDQSVSISGTLRPRMQVQVVSEVGARLMKVLKDEGARVRGGEVLAVLDATDYRLSHDRAKAALQVAEANRSHAGAESERAANLVKTGGITDKERLAADVNLRVAEAGLAQARAEAAIAAEQHGRTEIRAPFAGRVARRLADPGSMLAAGTPVFTVVDDSVFELRAAVPSVSYHAMRVGAPVTLSFDSLPGINSVGRIARVTPLIDERSRSFEAVIEVPGNPALVGGMFGRAVVQVGRVAGALGVPPAALIRNAASAQEAEVFVVTGTRADRRRVQLGTDLADAVQVTGGLTAGEQVIVDPPPALASGADVEIQPARATAVATTPAAPVAAR